jgi:hypothetical protein
MKRKAFTIYEMLFAIALLLMIGIMMSRFGWQVIRTMGGVRSEATHTARLDNAIQAIRQDVWNAAALRTNASHELVITPQDHHEITWTWETDGHLVRLQSSGVKNDWGLMPEMAMSVDAGTVRVIVSDAPPVHGGSFRMQSPVMLLEGKP